MENFYEAHEIHADTGEPTGRVEVYQAQTASEAADALLYTRRLADGNARLGQTHRVVYTKGYAWAILNG